MDRRGLTSNVRKLLYRCDCLLSTREGWPRPVMFLVSPTNCCQLNCPFCLYGGRDKGLELPFADLLRFVEASDAIGVKTWELTGGGEPLLYPQISELLSELHERDFAVGLMTNGLALDRLQHPEYLSWVRVSLHSDMGAWGRLAEQAARISHEVKVTFSFTATQDNVHHLPSLCGAAERYGWTVKVEPDWFGVQDGSLRQQIADTLGDYTRVFLDPVEPATGRVPGPCYMHLVKPFLYTDGWLYACPCAVGQCHDVASPFRVCRMEDVAVYYARQPAPLILACQSCKYHEHNQVAESVIEPLEDPEFC